MSKLYEKYLEQKASNPNKIYLIKNGNFFLFLGKDAELISKELGLKLSKFSNESEKCGFPIGELEKYLRFLKLLNIDCEVIYNDEDVVINSIKSIIIEDLKGDQAIKLLSQYQKIVGGNNGKQE